MIWLTLPCFLQVHVLLRKQNAQISRNRRNQIIVKYYQTFLVDPVLIKLSSEFSSGQPNPSTNRFLSTRKLRNEEDANITDLLYPFASELPILPSQRTFFRIDDRFISLNARFLTFWISSFRYIYVVHYITVKDRKQYLHNFILKATRAARSAANQHSSCFAPLYSLTIDHVLSIAPKICEVTHNHSFVFRYVR